jgi:hypothetical protein
MHARTTRALQPGAAGRPRHATAVAARTGCACPGMRATPADRAARAPTARRPRPRRCASRLGSAVAVAGRDARPDRAATRRSNNACRAPRRSAVRAMTVRLALHTRRSASPESARDPGASRPFLAGNPLTATRQEPKISPILAVTLLGRRNMPATDRHLAFALLAMICGSGAGCSVFETVNPYPDGGEAGPDARLDGAHDGGLASDAGPRDAGPRCQTTGCPPDRACDPRTGACATSCSVEAGVMCNGGCCSGGFCQPGLSDPSSCGTTGGACVVCTGNGAACVGGSCGCHLPSDCSAYNACTNGTCSPECGTSKSSACHEGCCSHGRCVQGTTAEACGANGGSCADCDASSLGPVCMSSQTCGCEGACTTGCCDMTSQQCVSGTTSSLCGSGGACVNCFGAPCKDGFCL